MSKRIVAIALLLAALTTPMFAEQKSSRSEQRQGALDRVWRILRTFAGKVSNYEIVIPHP
jgi:muconolactone delta-isomerase